MNAKTMIYDSVSQTYKEVVLNVDLNKIEITMAGNKKSFVVECLNDGLIASIAKEDSKMRIGVI